MGRSGDRYCRATFRYHGGLDVVPVECDVLDGRSPSAPRDFERHGFDFVDAPSAVDDWTDQSQIDQVVRPEFGEFVRTHVGCDTAVVFPFIARSEAAAADVADYGPIEFVHSDFTDDYGPMVTEDDRPYRKFLDPLLASQGLDRDLVTSASRLAVVQGWRNTGPTQADMPLAVCDATSVDRSRLIAEVIPYYGGLRLDFEIYAVRPPAGDAPDRWYTFPAMQSNEMIVLRTYDSACADEGRPFWTPHSAFRDPHVAATPDTRRESVEVRALCVWN
ncbi:MAG: CmcJ/NvfI family oxidoreductase [Actinomycetota bacterium]